MSDKLVVTMCNEAYASQLLNEFLPSLRKEGQYTGNVVILDYGLSEETVKKAIRFNALVIKCSTFPQFQKTVDHLRAKHILNVLTDWPEIQHVAYSDCGDVWFQAPVNELFEVDGFGLAPEVDTWDCGWCQNVINHIVGPIKEEINSTLCDKVMRNFGIHAGDRQSFLSFLNNHIEYTSRIGKILLLVATSV